MQLGMSLPEIRAFEAEVQRAFESECLEPHEQTLTVTRQELLDMVGLAAGVACGRDAAAAEFDLLLAASDCLIGVEGDLPPLS